MVVKHAGKTRFARVKIPDVLPRFVPLPASLSRDGARTFVYLEDVIRTNLALLFPGTQVKGAHLFRVVRDADLVIQEDEADDLLESIDQGLKESRRGALAMLQVEATTPRRVLDILSRTSRSRMRSSTARAIGWDSATGCSWPRCRGPT